MTEHRGSIPTLDRFLASVVAVAVVGLLTVLWLTSGGYALLLAVLAMAFFGSVLLLTGPRGFWRYLLEKGFRVEHNFPPPKHLDHEDDLPPLPDLDQPLDLPPPNPTIFAGDDMARPKTIHDAETIIERELPQAQEVTEVSDYEAYLEEHVAIITERTVFSDWDKLLGVLADRTGTATQYGHDTHQRVVEARRLLSELVGRIESRKLSLPEAIDAVQRGEPLL